MSSIIIFSGSHKKQSKSLMSAEYLKERIPIVMNHSGINDIDIYN